MARQRVYRVRSVRGYAGIDRRVQGVEVALGQEGQPGHGQVLVGLGESEGDRPFGQAVDAAHGPDDSQPGRGDNLCTQGLWISGPRQQGTRSGAGLPCSARARLSWRSVLELDQLPAALGPIQPHRHWHHPPAPADQHQDLGQPRRVLLGDDSDQAAYWHCWSARAPQPCRQLGPQGQVAALLEVESEKSAPALAAGW